MCGSVLIVLGTITLLLAGALGGAMVDLWPRAPWNPHLILVLVGEVAAIMTGVLLIVMGAREIVRRGAGNKGRTSWCVRVRHHLALARSWWRFMAWLTGP